MSTILNRQNEHVLNKEQFDRKVRNGTLVKGTVYHITDYSIASDGSEVALGIPKEGQTGHVLTKTENGTEWRASETAVIPDGAVTTEKIEDGSINKEKLSDTLQEELNSINIKVENLESGIGDIASPDSISGGFIDNLFKPSEFYFLTELREKLKN